MELPDSGSLNGAAAVISNFITVVSTSVTNIIEVTADRGSSLRVQTVYVG